MVPHADPELGTLGELFILSLENERLKDTGKIPMKMKDGEGYDILSWDDKGNEIHIEVKTTSGNLKDRIVVTKDEHLKSISDPSYWIYRVYDFDKRDKTGKIKKIKGSFEGSFKMEPSQFYGSFKSGE